MERLLESQRQHEEVQLQQEEERRERDAYLVRLLEELEVHCYPCMQKVQQRFCVVVA